MANAAPSSNAGRAAIDLLGLDTAPAPAAPAASSGLGFLVDVFGDQPATNGVDNDSLTPGAEENFRK